MLGHFHIDAVEAGEKTGAAEGPAAGADAAQNGRFIADADLTEFDANAEEAGEIRRSSRKSTRPSAENWKRRSLRSKA